MQARSKALLVLTAAALAATAAVFIPADCQARARRKQPGKYLVPPPPAYMPSILPEAYARGSRSPRKEPEDPAKKYIYTAQGYEDPKPRRPNQHVTYWNGN